ncbi:hypothetical protein IT398_00500, partial [Candidatus Nomurabacteria bacterium]|nr:hypothetical protein [Candidatus Nomurabacteria bacterium]
KILWWSFGFFVVMAMVTLFVFYRGRNLVSSGNVVLKITGPTEIAAGQELSLQTSITNKNQASLELVDLIVTYPSGTRVAGDTNQALVRERLPLGEIKPGETVNRLVRSVLFGEKGSRQTINFSVEYRLEDSNAIFDKNSSYSVDISSTPLVIQLDLPEEVNSNQEIVLNAEVQSNAESAIADPYVIVTYPAGFRFSKATPSPVRGQNVWRFASLNSGEKRTIQIRGTIEGQDDEQKSFRVSAGTMEDENADDLSATLGATFSTLTIKRPYVSLVVTTNGSAVSEYPSNSREPLRVDIDWVNNLAGEITDAEVVANIVGGGLDPTTVSSGRGFYNSRAGNILWSKVNDDKLGVITPGSSGRNSFSFSSISLVGGVGAGLRDPVITLEVEFRGKRISDSGNTEPVFSSVTQKIKLNSDIQLTGEVLQRTGPFQNRGPLPPKVDQETTYTIVWSVLNSSNNLEGAKVTATLPSYVKWLGVREPTSETISFQSSISGGGDLIWDLGAVAPGVGTISSARRVSFQVSLTPSLSQVGEAPALVLDSTFSGLDTFTRQALTAKLRRALNTTLTNEPGFQIGQERVTNQI